MHKNKKPLKDSSWKNSLKDGLFELGFVTIVLIVGLCLMHLVPYEYVDGLTGELFFLLAAIIVCVVGIVVLLIAKKIKRKKQDKVCDMEEKPEFYLPPHQMKLRPSPFAAIQSGHKTVELRLNDEKRQKIKIGDTLVFTQTETGETIRAVVLDIRKYPDFEALYQMEDPIAMGYSDGETVDPHDMSQYYRDDEIRKYGTLALEIKKL